MIILNYYLAARALDIDLGLIAFIFIVPVVATIAMLPISIGGIGLRENSLVFIMVAMGVINEKAAIFSLLIFAMFLILGLLGGITYIVRPFFERRMEASEDNNIKEKLSIAAFNQKFIVEAPINIIVCANLKRISWYGNRGRELYCIQDASAAVEHILLLAVDNGLDACWVGAFDENKVSKILDLPSYVRPIAIIPIGYSNEQRTSTPRIDTKLLIHFNHW